MADPKDILRYLRECYRENGSRGGIWNLFGNSVQNRVFVEDRDLVVAHPGSGTSHYLRNPDAEKAAGKAFVSRKEKDLVYATLFITGWVERFDGKPEMVCAPLFVFPATLTSEGFDFGAKLEIDLTGRQINYAVLEAIGGEALVDSIEEAIEPEALTEGCVGQIRNLFSEFVAEASTDELLNFPHLISESELRKNFMEAGEDPGSRLKLLPAAAIALVNKSTQMRGVLNELEEMASPETVLSPPVRALMGESPETETARWEGAMPAILSQSQQQIVESARRNALTLAIGPPGTGKSFTIAALAIETLSWGGSVLIASKMDHAVDVVGDKIETAVGLSDAVVRGGRSKYLSDLKRFMEELLAGTHTAEAADADQLKELEIRVRESDGQIERFGKMLRKRLDRERKWGEILSSPSKSFFNRLRIHFVVKRVRNLMPAWELAGELNGMIEDRLRQVLDYLHHSRKYRLKLSLERGRGMFQKFVKALRARTGSKRDEYFESFYFGELLQALPVWLVNLSDVHRVLPMAKGQFDLAIIDEATQCDMASALPVLQRARRAVITGDPKQLRHLSFLPHARLGALGDQFDLDEDQRQQFNFRDVSLLDLASDQIRDQGQVAFLNEHFRSRPEIIAFSNRQFYGGKLHVMTGHRETDRVSIPPLRINRIEGTRGEGGVNREEAKAVLDEIANMAARNLSLRGAAVHSIGILSPFRDQVEHLRKGLATHPIGNSLMQRHDVLIGTSHTFQGEERDLMFLSLALDDQSPATSFRFLEKPDVFNVAVTRARLLNHVFHSFDPGRLKPDSILARYLAYAGEFSNENEKEPSIETPGRRSHDQFASEVAEWLRSQGAEVTLGYPLAGMEVDLLYTFGSEIRAIDLVGYPGVFADAFPLERVLTFRRAGLEILPLPYAAWHCGRKACEAWLMPDQFRATSTRT